MKSGARSKVGQDAIARKIARLRSGKPLRVLDMFSGCGGISLGFQGAGFQVDAAVELDELAAETHARNFHGHLEPEMVARHAKSRDMTKLEPDELVEDLQLGPVTDAFDVLVGGPPCQAYARVGRAKLREIAEHPTAFKVDPRGNLYLRYLHYVKAAQPLAIVIENVPDVLNYGGHNVMGEIAEALADLGYTAKYSLINTAFHGVPQMRDRVFLIAYRKELGIEVRFPKAQHHMVLPPGYDGTRSVALKFIDLFGGGDFIEADHGDRSLPGPVTCHQALGDLPPITLHLEGLLRRGARRFDEMIPYDPKRAMSPYARFMRSWPGFDSPDGVWDHVIRYLRVLVFGSPRCPTIAAIAAVCSRRISRGRLDPQGGVLANDIGGNGSALRGKLSVMPNATVDPLCCGAHVHRLNVGHFRHMNVEPRQFVWNGSTSTGMMACRSRAVYRQKLKRRQHIGAEVGRAQGPPQVTLS